MDTNLTQIIYSKQQNSSSWIDLTVKDTVVILLLYKANTQH